ncbi:hypothetical protein DXG03_005144 [Asterophora parasitica]|uniref:Ribosomal RNA-processing protein 42 n=1 Tax=Asterophora parasitica TaxID=117018 RepID=A0A9P7G613_9AGAR|nr:hypothetical protein DXG03_005144 [Asterophora parasitica]
MLSLSKAEKSYIRAGLLATPPSRADGRALLDCRSIALETGIAPLANGSARLSIGGGTEVVAATKVEVESIENNSDGRDGGPLDDLQTDLTILLHQTLSHHSLHPKNLGILPTKKSWLLNLDVLVLSDAGNIFDALFMASRAALWDTRVPRTRNVEYNARTRKTTDGGKRQADVDVDEETQSGFDTRMIHKATDFELPDYWDEGEVLDGRDMWPIAVTLNLESPVHFLDATAQEETATALRMLFAFSFPALTAPVMQAMRMLGPGEMTPTQLKELVRVGEHYAREMFSALNSKLKEEDVRRNHKAREIFELHR